MAEKWLVIDDSATIQRVIKLAFQDYDVLITEADSIQEALRELASTPSSLVIVDAALAGVQSVHDFSKLPQSSPSSSFVILEGSYDHIDENQFRGAGFRYFLKKPFDAAQLIAITREALGRPIPHRYNNNEKLSSPPRTRSPFSVAESPREAGPSPFAPATSSSASSSSSSPSFSQAQSPSPSPSPVMKPQEPQTPSKPTRSFMDDFSNPGYSNPESFDLGLDHFNDPKVEEKPEVKVVPKVEPTRRPESFGIDPFEAMAFNSDPFKAKPYNPEPEMESPSEPEAQEPPDMAVKPFSPPPIQESLNPSYSQGSFSNESSWKERSSPHLAAAPYPLNTPMEPVEQEHALEERAREGALADEDNSYIASPLSGMLEPMLQEEMGKLVRQSVEEYCRKHFAELAREFLMREIDKLSQERSRLLVDK